jgi:hypothetical protein
MVRDDAEEEVENGRIFEETRKSSWPELDDLFEKPTDTFKSRSRSRDE